MKNKIRELLENIESICGGLSGVDFGNINLIAKQALTLIAKPAENKLKDFIVDTFRQHAENKWNWSDEDVLGIIRSCVISDDDDEPAEQVIVEPMGKLPGITKPAKPCETCGGSRKVKVSENFHQWHKALREEDKKMGYKNIKRPLKDLKNSYKIYTLDFADMKPCPDCPPKEPEGPVCSLCEGSKEFIRMGEPCPDCQPAEKPCETCALQCTDEEGGRYCGNKRCIHEYIPAEKPCTKCGGHKKVLQHCNDCIAERGKFCRSPNCKIITCPRCKDTGKEPEGEDYWRVECKKQEQLVNELGPENDKLQAQLKQNKFLMEHGTAVLMAQLRTRITELIEQNRWIPVTPETILKGKMKILVLSLRGNLHIWHYDSKYHQVTLIKECTYYHIITLPKESEAQDGKK